MTEREAHGPSEEEILDAAAIIQERLSWEDVKQIYTEVVAHLNATYGADNYTDEELQHALGERVLNIIDGPGS